MDKKFIGSSMMNKDQVRQNYMRHIVTKCEAFNEAYKLSDNLKGLRNRKEDSNALQYVLEDIYRKALKTQEVHFKELLTIIDSYHLNESNGWVNVGENNGISL